MIYIFLNKATAEQISEMLKEYDTMIKIVVDIRRRILAGGVEMDSDCESVLLGDGSEQDDLWEPTGFLTNRELHLSL
jgi:hypothetical protein